MNMHIMFIQWYLVKMNQFGGTKCLSYPSFFSFRLAKDSDMYDAANQFFISVLVVTSFYCMFMWHEPRCYQACTEENHWEVLLLQYVRFILFIIIDTAFTCVKAAGYSSHIHTYIHTYILIGTEEKIGGITRNGRAEQHVGRVMWGVSAPSIKWLAVMSGTPEAKRK